MAIKESNDIEEDTERRMKIKSREYEEKIWSINMGGTAWERIDSPYGFCYKKVNFWTKINDFCTSFYYDYQA